MARTGDQPPRRLSAMESPEPALGGLGDRAKKYSPEQIAGRLKLQFPHSPEMQVSTQTIYQSVYMQSRGALKRDLTRSRYDLS